MGLEGGLANTVDPIGGVEGTQVELIDGVKEEVGQVIRGEPVLQGRRHEEELVPIGADEVVAGHAHPPAAGSMTEIPC